MNCLFCGGLAKTREDIIPKWLQRHYNLWNQKMFLPNRTGISYRQLKVPSCPRCNNVLFSKLESKISTQSGTLDDYYLWALKIHWGLITKDTTLFKKLSSPQEGKMIDPVFISEDLEFAQQFFKAVSGRPTQFHPSPFGSVILLDTKGTNFELFDFVHSFSLGCVAITLKTKLLIVFFNDRQAVRANVNFKALKEKVVDGLQLRFFLLDMGYWAMRRRDIPHGIFAFEGPNQTIVGSSGSFVKPHLSEFNDQDFTKLARSVGIRVEKATNNQWAVAFLGRAKQARKRGKVSSK